MDNKLSELSKPVAWAFKDANDVEHASIIKKANLYGRHDFQPLYSQEYVSALLAELEAKDTPKDIRVAEIEKRLKQRAEEMERILEGITPEMIAGGWTAKGISDYAKSLEAKLATPVDINLPERRDDSYDWDGASPSEAFNTCRSICGLMFRQQLRAAGVTVEGDE
ncbi:hypothetical protein JEP93_14260 [Serratia marcescens]|nr:hypothetical protein [Serratia marcescens]